MSTDYNVRAAKGQAFNLAVHDAIALGKQEDVKYILTKYVKYYKLSDTVQGISVDEIYTEINSLVGDAQ